MQKPYTANKYTYIYEEADYAYRASTKIKIRVK